ncbi:DUF2993 domain-containing protein [Microbacterium candidum]|uniref:DUF2993 domain-containing protein n=1 Tax=Microbacterium candidum TaxID=3041922 RepID=A0ABT7N193_9MICO|nr:DUF2993 domain-containing protein [Microbacterium sp. ASV49]MDL9980467.1 DUF2993 domain-containing protein [Microbacterium sp. ASV49]
MKKPWIWIASVGGVVVLAVGAWFAGEWVASQIVTSTVREQVIETLALPADQQIDVAVSGAVLPQLIGGTIDDITVSSQNVTVGEFTGDVSVHATGVPTRGSGDIESATATVTIDEAELQRLLSTVKGFPADTVGLAEPDVTMSKTLNLLGLSVPVAVGLTPSAQDGKLILTPDYVKVAGAQLSAADVKSRFGDAASAVVRDWPVCIAQYLPAGVTLTDVAVTGNELVTHFAIDGAIAHDKSLQEKGTCA